MTDTHFADRFIEASRRLGTPLCVGLDPHLELIPAEFGVLPGTPASPRTVAGVLQFLAEVVQECAGRVAIVKPQIAFFEQLGWRGIQALEELVAAARKQGLLVLLDAKRGDVGSTAEAYARAYLLPDSPCRVDALTVNPYLGLDSLAPFFAAARESGAGVFVLAQTSNAGAADFQQLMCDGQPLFERVASALASEACASTGALGWSALGIVAGATFPESAIRLRKLLPHSLFLVPGFGAQGARAQTALASFVPGAHGLEGGLVSSSRGVLFDSGSATGDWRAGFRARLLTAIAELSSAATIHSGERLSETPSSSRR
jgi:orotidine-5'-phosphate decarboxylase